MICLDFERQGRFASERRPGLSAREVVDAIGSGRKKTYKGREYDYVFDVDISTDSGSGSSAKLPYNAGGKLLRAVDSSNKS